MKKLSVLIAASILLGAVVPAARADEIPEKYRPTVKKGLDWLKKNQTKQGAPATTRIPSR